MKLQILVLIALLSGCATVKANDAGKVKEYVGFDYCQEFELGLSASEIPKTWEQASRLLLNSLPPAAKNDFIAHDGNFAACFPNVIEGKIRRHIDKAWNLSSPDMSLAMQLNKMGFWTSDEKTRIILAGALMAYKNEPFNERLPMRQKFLSEQDGTPVDMHNVPCDLLDQHLIMSTEVIAGYARGLRWGQCSDGQLVNYLWERGWFFPTMKELAEFCRDQPGDEQHYCTKLNASGN